MDAFNNNNRTDTKRVQTSCKSSPSVDGGGRRAASLLRESKELASKKNDLWRNFHLGNADSRMYKTGRSHRRLHYFMFLQEPHDASLMFVLQEGGLFIDPLQTVLIVILISIYLTTR